MSGAISDSLIGTYLNIVKNEQAQVTAQEKADAPTQVAIAALRKRAPDITSPTSVLNNFASLQVILGATGLSSSIGQTALLKDLLTQDPTSSTSLVQETANTQYLAFAEAMQSRPAVQFQLGPASDLTVVTGGSYAATFTVQNAAYAGNPSQQSATNVGRQWNFVLNDGSADASVATALNTATGGTYNYTVADGIATGSAGAPAVTVTTDASGNTVYTVNTATDSTGAATQQISVVSVKVAASTSTGASSQIASLVTAMTNAGLDASLQANGSLNVIGGTLDHTGLPLLAATASINTSTSSTVLQLGSAAVGAAQGELVMDGTTVIGQVDSVDSFGNVTLTGDARAAVAAGDTLHFYAGLAVSTTAASATTTADTVLALGGAGTDLVPGQVLRDNGRVVGTIASIDGSGNVTLTANAAVAVAAGDTISVAPAAVMSGVGVVGTANTAAAAGSTTLSLSAGAASFTAGQVLVDNGTIVGTIGAIDSLGNVTLTGSSLAPVASGDTIVGSPPVTGTTVAALSDPQNLNTLINEYETNQYEAAQGQQNLGMQEALYYTRSIGSITTINQLMSDPTLLSVVEANLGLPSAFANLDFDTQSAYLTAHVTLTNFQNAAYVKSSAEQYLTLVQENNPSQSTPADSILNLFNSGSVDASGAILNVLYSAALSTTPSLPATSGNDQSTSAILSLFA